MVRDGLGTSVACRDQSEISRSESLSDQTDGVPCVKVGTPNAVLCEVDVDTEIEKREQEDE